MPDNSGGGFVFLTAPQASHVAEAVRDCRPNRGGELQLGEGRIHNVGPELRSASVGRRLRDPPPLTEL
ncbi:hypothetical protein EYF80_029421 [Liparis tanakae]|uniref:Uncharacterized protein n=1 Tax=Liparis tanakae TaxID=230148 RepID=A0A4Z2H4G0_9TELE|nr:hypothetical protein EYF80_029421 [Liparis tanakae]